MPLRGRVRCFLGVCETAIAIETVHSVGDALCVWWVKLVEVEHGERSAATLEFSGSWEGCGLRRREDAGDARECGDGAGG